jgi:phospholipid-binding lipoprotein MlaA
MRLHPKFALSMLLLGHSLIGWAEDAAPNSDPWERLNRTTFCFNEFMDRTLLKPIAKGYQVVTPQFVDRGVSNFFSNIEEVPIFANHLLQFEGKYAVKGLGRLVVNSTIGLLGLFDVASKMGIERHETDLGLTFGHWGAGPGPYLVLPFFGPSTVRDGIGRAGDAALDPISYPDEKSTRVAARSLEAVDLRADLLSVEELVTGDRYVFLRDTYLQRRAYQISGELPEEEEDFLEDDEL